MKPKENFVVVRFTPELGNIIKFYLKCHLSPEGADKTITVERGESSLAIKILKINIILTSTSLIHIPHGKEVKMKLLMVY